MSLTAHKFFCTFEIFIMSARQQLIKYYTDSKLQTEKDYYSFSDFFDYPKCEIEPMEIFKMSHGYLLFYNDIGCIRNFIHAIMNNSMNETGMNSSMKYTGMNDIDEKFYARKIIEQLCEEHTIYFEEPRDIFIYTKLLQCDNNSNDDMLIQLMQKLNSNEEIPNNVYQGTYYSEHF